MGVSFCRFNLFTGCPRTQTCTLILRGGAEQFIEETERSLHDAIMIVRRTIKHDAVVAGTEEREGEGEGEGEGGKVWRCERVRWVEGRKRTVLHPKKLCGGENIFSGRWKYALYTPRIIP